jgi:ribonuclease III
MTMESIEDRFRNLLREEGREGIMALALTPRSVGTPDNERLEFLGNAVLNMLLAEAIFERCPDLPPATMSLMCNYLRSNPVLVMVGQEGGLESTLRRRQNNGNGKVTDRMVSTAFEAIVGSLYVNAGLSAASRFVDGLLLKDYLISYSMNAKGPITELKELVDRDRLVIGQNWTEIEVDGRKRFTCEKTFEGVTVTGEGGTKKMAEAIAAAKMMEIVGRISNLK